MPAPQSSIFNESGQHYYYLEYRVEASTELFKAKLKKALQAESADVSMIVAFGKRAWDLLQPDWSPKELIQFSPIDGVNGYRNPSTQRDLLIILQSAHIDHCYDQVMQVQNAIQEVAVLELELPGFCYHGSRDLIGFVDGTGNPKEDERLKAALLPEGEVGAGGSYVLSQKWVHDLNAFNQLSVGEQEKIVGRTKVDDIELEGDAMPDDSHVSRTDVKIDGKAMKIFRRSAPFGNAHERGLYFLAFACELERFQVQLERMFGVAEDGVHDRLIEYSKPVTSSYWFAPSQSDLDYLLK